VTAEVHDANRPIQDDNIIVVTDAILDTCATNNFMSEALFLQICGSLDLRCMLQLVTRALLTRTFRSFLSIDWSVTLRYIVFLFVLLYSRMLRTSSSVSADSLPEMLSEQMSSILA
jgi:hypothetical protein